MANDRLRKIWEVQYVIDRTEPIGAGGTSQVQRAAVVTTNQAVTPELYKKIHDLLTTVAAKGELRVISINHYMAGTVYLLED